jgi:hypothetical protein
LLLGKRQPNLLTLAKMCVAVSRLQSAEMEEVEQTRSLLGEVRRRCKLERSRRFARRAGVDPANLNRVLENRRKPSKVMLAKPQVLLAQGP